MDTLTSPKVIDTAGFTNELILLRAGTNEHLMVIHNATFSLGVGDEMLVPMTISTGDTAMIECTVTRVVHSVNRTRRVIHHYVHIVKSSTLSDLPVIDR